MKGENQNPKKSTDERLLEEELNRLFQEVEFKPEFSFFNKSAFFYAPVSVNNTILEVEQNENIL